MPTLSFLEATAIESRFGLSSYTSTTLSTTGFVGVLKSRFSDFIVHEVAVDGTMATLNDKMPPSEEIVYAIDTAMKTAGEAMKETLKETPPQDTPPPPPSSSSPTTSIIAAADKIVALFDQANATALSTSISTFLATDFTANPTAPHFLALPPCADKKNRGQVHGIIRTDLKGIAVADTLAQTGQLRLFPALYATESTSYNPPKDSNKRPNADSSGRASKKQKIPWPASRGGDYLRFSLYKENMDTMFAVKNLEQKLRLPPRTGVNFAGTKDKRGVTTQYCTVYRKTPEDVKWLNKQGNSGGGGSSTGGRPIMQLGDFEYVTNALRLGMLKGNRFDIVLRNIGLLDQPAAEPEDIKSVVDACCTQLKANGFINYFGMQRFGKYYDNAEAGVHLIKNDFASAVDVLMRVKDGDDFNICSARKLWDDRDKSSDEGCKEAASACLKKLNTLRNVMSEVNLMKHLSHKPTDFKGAFFRIPKNMMLMFLHAVQSAVWNKVASLRVATHGSDAVVAGDLVQINAGVRDPESDAKHTQMAGKDVIEVSKEDAEANKYKPEDVVLPLPGNKVAVPASCAAFYEDVLKEVFGGDCGDMKKLFTNESTKEFTLGGDYRKMLCRVDDLTWNVVKYDEPTQPLIETDLMKMRGESLGKLEEGKMLGLVVGFTLQSSSYATVAMRELQKAPQLSEFLKTMPLTKE